MKKTVALIATLVILAVSGGAAVAADGAKLFKKYCKACHLTTAKKKVGPGLKGVFGRESKVAGKLDNEGLHKWLKNPKSVYKKSKMAKLFKKKLKDAEIDAIIEYLKTL